MSQPSQQITQIIQKWRAGDEQELVKLYELVYAELKVIAARERQRFWNIDTISTTALVNEAYLKLIKQKELELEDRAHFYAVSATAMRQILVNYLEQKTAKKRGGGWQQVTISALENNIEDPHSVTHILSVNDAVEELQNIDKSLAEIVEMRFFAGMTEAEIGKVRNCSERTVRRNWQMAKALLQRALKETT